jgi:REP element-mobilizing transposase RayT
MPRAPRNAYPGGFFHVHTRGNNKQEIYLDGIDRYWFLEILGKVVTRYEWTVYAYCLMTNHYHLVLCIPEGGLSEGMCELNGGFARWANIRHGRCDHLFGKRFGSREIVLESYLLQACRYVVLNPVRAGLVDHPEDWVWSSYRACAGLDYPPKWFDPGALLRVFSPRPKEAMQSYRRFVEAGLVEAGQVRVPGTDGKV